MSRSPSRLRRLAGAALLAGLVCAGCARPGLTLGSQNLVRITEPRELATVSLPMTMRWAGIPLRAEPASKAPFYAVFIDHPPIEAGQNLVVLVDRQCQKEAGCANVAYFATHGVFITRMPWVTITNLPGALGQTPKDNLHQAVVIMVDSAGNRIGGWSSIVDFRLGGHQPGSLYS